MKNTMKKKLKVLGTSFLLVIGSLIGATAFATPAHAATDLGGVSVYNACVYQNGTPSSVVNVTGDVMGWRCRYFGGWNYVDLGVDLSKECRRVHGSTAYAGYTNFSNPNSWHCYR